MSRLLLCLLACLPLPALANPYLGQASGELRRALADIPSTMDENWYQVEMLVFARSSTLAEEYWRLNQQPDLNRGALIVLNGSTPLLPDHADPDTEQAASLGAWQLLEGAPALSAVAEKLRQRGERVLLHEQWRQPVGERNQAFPVLVEGGDILPMATAPAEQPLTDNNPTSTPEGPAESTSAIDEQGQLVELPTLDVDTEQLPQRELQGAVRLHLSRYLHVEPLIWFASQHPEHGPVWVKIEQKRRMRSEEIHYLDHPLFGVLLQLTPWQHPQQQRKEQIEQAIKAAQVRP